MNCVFVRFLCGMFVCVPRTRILDSNRPPMRLWITCSAQQKQPNNLINAFPYTAFKLLYTTEVWNLFMDFCRFGLVFYTCRSHRFLIHDHLHGPDHSWPFRQSNRAFHILKLLARTHWIYNLDSSCYLVSDITCHNHLLVFYSIPIKL